MLIWVDVCLAKYKEKCPLILARKGKNQCEKMWKIIVNEPHQQRPSNLSI